jgi:hypothetical protein
MAVSERIRERIATFSVQLAEEELGQVDASNALSWLDAVEARAVEIADAVVAELVKLEVQKRPPEADEASCPGCGQAGRYEGKRPRTLLTRRGPTTLAEPEYYCPCCRKAFFPADPGAGR